MVCLKILLRSCDEYYCIETCQFCNGLYRAVDFSHFFFSFTQEEKMLHTRPTRPRRKTAVQRTILGIKSRREARQREKRDPGACEARNLSLALFAFIQTRFPPFPDELRSKLDRKYCEEADSNTYKKLCLLFHPDKVLKAEYKQDTTEIFVKLQALKRKQNG